MAVPLAHSAHSLSLLRAGTRTEGLRKNGTGWSFLGIGGEEHTPAAADFVVLCFCYYKGVSAYYYLDSSVKPEQKNKKPDNKIMYPSTVRAN